ncbi:hypothetical protein ACKKBG_A27020 [Auxenochlorella protothecoides x Auxenochlorella symbiontica]
MSGGGLSLAFTGPARKARRLEVHETIEAVVREEITGVGAGGVQTAGTGNPLADLKVIEAQPNSFKIASGKFVPSYIPEAADRADQEGGIDKFEAAAQDAVDAQGDVTYGLIRRDRTDEASTSRRAQGAGSGAVLGPGDQETLALRRDLTALPEVASLDAYEAMPVEMFGEALLRGMGWREGTGLGRNRKEGAEPAQPKDLKRRPARLGLGASAAPVPTHKRHIKPGETRAAAAEGPVDNKGAAHIPLAERNPAELGAGEAAWVVVGTHSGLACTFVGLEAKREGRSERARVRLQPSNEVVVVRVSDLSLAAPSRQRSRGKCDGRGQEAGEERSRRAPDGPQLGDGSLRKQSDSRAGEGRADASSPWLLPNIRVKVVDKRAEGGRVYLKKGTVVDVAMPRVCDVHLDDLARTVQGLHQDQLETVVPGVEGTPVLLLAGRLRGRHGRLLRRNTEAGAAAVQLTADGSLVKVSLDEVAEYAGPEHDDE